MSFVCYVDYLLQELMEPLRTEFADSSIGGSTFSWNSHIIFPGG